MFLGLEHTALVVWTHRWFCVDELTWCWIGSVTLVAIRGTTILVLSLDVKSLQFTWRSDIRSWKLRVHQFQLSFRDLTALRSMSLLVTYHIGRTQHLVITRLNITLIVDISGLIIYLALASLIPAWMRIIRPVKCVIKLRIHFLAAQLKHCWSLGTDQ